MLISFLDTPSERQLDANYLIDILQTSFSQGHILWERKERFRLRKRKAAPANWEWAWPCQRGISVSRSWSESHSKDLVLSSGTRTFQSTIGQGHSVTMKKWDIKQNHSVILSTKHGHWAKPQIPNISLSCLLWVTAASLSLPAPAWLCTSRLLSKIWF